MKTLALAALLVVSTVSGVPQINGRGFFSDVAGLFQDFGEVVDDFQERAGEEVERLKPALKSADDDLDEAMVSLKSAFDKLADSFGSGPGFEFGSIDPMDGQGIIEAATNTASERVERPPPTGVEVPSIRMPSLFAQAFKPPMMSKNDPFSSIFKFAFKQPWYEGPNVCVNINFFEEGSGDGKESETEKEEEEEAKEEALKEESDPNKEVEYIEQSRNFFGSFSSTVKSCSNGPNFYECKTITSDGNKKTVKVVRYECCYGYSRSVDSDGCTELNMQSMVDTLEGLEAEEFEQMLETSGVIEDMPENVTIFVPSNDAVEDFRHDLEELNAIMISGSGKEGDDDVVVYNVDDGFSYRRRKRAPEAGALGAEKLSEIVKGHMVKGFVSSGDVRDEDMIETLGQNKLRITIYNTYPEKVVMANCARVTSRDHYATNGIAHIVDKVILPATQTVAEIVAEDVQLRTLNKVLDKNRLLEKLGNKDGQFTIFAPTDEAFEKLDTGIRLKMMRGNGCGQDILNNHVLPNVICSGVIESKAKSINVMNKYLTLDKDDEDVFTVNGVRIITRDIMATNGVIHVIEEVIVPETAVTIGQALEEKQRTTLKDLLDLAGLTQGLNDMTNVTMFAPRERALKTDFSAEFLDELKQDQQKLRDFLMLHVVSPKKCLCELEDNMLLKTGVEGKKIRINKYHSAASGGGKYPLPLEIIGIARPTYTAQCARISPKEIEVCGGILHSIDKPMMESAPHVMDILKTNPEFEEFIKLIEVAEMEEEINELTNGESDAAAGLVTIFAPKNVAFEDLRPDKKDKLFDNKAMAKKVVRGHMLNKFLCCAGIRRRNPFFNTATKVMLDQRARVVRKSRGDRFYVDDAEITECDKVADNGVVHAVDKVFLPQRNRVVESRKTNLRRILDLITEF